MDTTPNLGLVLPQDGWGSDQRNNLRKIDAAMAGVATGTLTPAQVAGLATKPVVAIPAAGPGTIIVVLDAEYSLQFPASGGVPYNGASVPDLLLYYANNSNESISAANNLWLCGAQSAVFFDVPAMESPENGYPSAYFNAPIVFGINPVCTITQGNSPIKYRMSYRVFNV